MRVMRENIYYKETCMRMFLQKIHSKTFYNSNRPVYCICCVLVDHKHVHTTNVPYVNMLNKFAIGSKRDVRVIFIDIR